MAWNKPKFAQITGAKFAMKVQKQEKKLQGRKQKQNYRFKTENLSILHRSKALLTLKSIHKIYKILIISH